MGRNIRGGSKHKKSKTTMPSRTSLKQEGEMYALVEKMLGDGRASVLTEEKEQKIGWIRGKIRKAAWITPNSYVIITKRDFDESKVDIVHSIPYMDAKSLGIDDIFETNVTEHNIMFEEDFLVEHI